jgi:hypothetical protein
LKLVIATLAAVFILASFSFAQNANHNDLPDGPKPQLTIRPIAHVDGPFEGENAVVHNLPSAAAPPRQDRIFDWSFILGHGIYAGSSAFDSYETAKNLGSCAFENNADLGRNPSNKSLAVHGAVEFSAVLAGDALIKWAGQKNHVPRWLNQPLGLMAAGIGTGKHLKGGMDWVKNCKGHP